MYPLLAVIGVLASAEPLTPQRLWLERLAVGVPGPDATRWLLLGDAVCLVALGLGSRRPWLGVPLALAASFVALNALGMALTDFYLGLAVFHPLVGIATTIVGRQARWLGAGLVALALVLGILT